MSDVKILLTGGGSGGHVYPLLAVARELERLSVENKVLLEMHYMGPDDGYGDILRAHNLKISTISGAKIRRYFSFKNLLDVPKFIYGVFQALFKMYFLMPDVIFSKGGPGALAVVIAGWFYRIPVVIHESDAVPGLTNLLSRLFASRVAVSFEGAAKFFRPQITAVTGNPVRADLVAGAVEQRAAKESLALNPDEPLVFVIGGSQGSSRINEFIIVNLAALLKEAAVIHQTGRANIKDVERMTRASLLSIPVDLEKKHPYKAIAYLDAKEMALTLSAADVVVSRAGSGSISEIAAFGRPAILIPLLDAANDHQRLNAYEFSRAGAGVVIDEENLLPGIFLRQIRQMTTDLAVKEKMSAASKAFYKPQAARMIAQEVMKLAHGR